MPPPAAASAKVPIDNDIAADETHLRQRWAELQARLNARKELQEFYEQLRKDPQLLEKNPEAKKKLEELLRQSGALGDPRLKDELEKWMKNQSLTPGGPNKLSPEQLAAMKKFFDDLQKRMDNAPLPAPAPTATKPEHRTSAAPAASQPIDEEQLDGRRRFTQWLLEQSRQLNDPEFQNSELLREIRTDLGRFAGTHSLRDGDRWGVESKFGKRVTDLTRDLRTTRLWPEIHFSAPKIKVPAGVVPGFPSLGGWGRPPPLGGGLPGLGTPSMPSSAGPSTGFLLGLLGLAVAGFAAWRMLRKYTWPLGALRSHDVIDLPWPADSGTIATRADLIRAFEHLSLARLGMVSRTWNHHEVEAGLGGGAVERQDAARTLAGLYERVRYAPGREPLSTDAVAGARRALAVLAGGAAS